MRVRLIAPNTRQISTVSDCRSHHRSIAAMQPQPGRSVRVSRPRRASSHRTGSGTPRHTSGIPSHRQRTSPMRGCRRLGHRYESRRTSAIVAPVIAHPVPPRAACGQTAHMAARSAGAEIGIDRRSGDPFPQHDTSRYRIKSAKESPTPSVTPAPVGGTNAVAGLKQLSQFLLPLAATTEPRRTQERRP